VSTCSDADPARPGRCARGGPRRPGRAARAQVDDYVGAPVSRSASASRPPVVEPEVLALMAVAPGRPFSMIESARHPAPFRSRPVRRRRGRRDGAPRASSSRSGSPWRGSCGAWSSAATPASARETSSARRERHGRVPPANRALPCATRCWRTTPSSATSAPPSTRRRAGKADAAVLVFPSSRARARIGELHVEGNRPEVTRARFRVEARRGAPWDVRRSRAAAPAWLRDLMPGGTTRRRSMSSSNAGTPRRAWT